MGEGVEGYPRWDGELSEGRTLWIIAKQEIKRTWQDPWGLIALVLVASYTLFFIGQVQTAGSTAHTMDNGLSFVHDLRWGALAIAAIMAGPALLEDRLHNALELYLSRAVTRLDYLGGKIGATYDLAAIAMIGPGLVYWLLTFFLFTEHPEHWMLFPVGVVVHGLIWALVVTGLGLGLASVSSSSRVTALVLFGGFAIADIFVADILQSITKETALQILSPFSAHAQQVGWLFQADTPFSFPFWWGLIELLALIAVGWALVWWKHPRLAGADEP